MTTALVLLGVFILLAYTAEAMTGFGSIVIALSLGALLFPIEWLQTVLVPLNICMTGFLAWQQRRHLDAALLLRLVLPFTLLGTLAGAVLQPMLSGAGLKTGFAVLIVWFAGRELLRLQRAPAIGARPLFLTRVLIAAAGVTHGLFASGGPLLVYALAGTSVDKARFRASLILVWFVLNSTLTITFLAQGRLLPALPTVLLYLPLIPLGILLGERLHQALDEQRFRLWIYRLLLLAGLALLVSSLRALVA